MPEYFIKYSKHFNNSEAVSSDDIRWPEHKSCFAQHNTGNDAWRELIKNELAEDKSCMFLKIEEIKKL